MSVEADVDAVMDCLRSGWLTMGPRIQSFEDAFASEAGVPFAVTVSNGAAGLELALRAAGVTSGDEVLVPALGSVAATAAVRTCGAVAVALDGDLHADPGEVARHTSERTRAVVVSHVLGYAAPSGAFAQACDERGLGLVEDATEALGAELGPPALARCHGFAPGTQLEVGEGGVVLTSDEAVAVRVRSLRSHAMTSVTWDRHRGHAETYDIVDVGFNYRMDEPRAALALSRLARLGAQVDRRRELALALLEALTVPGVEPLVDAAAIAAGAPLALPVVAEDRDGLAARLTAAGLPGAVALAITVEGQPPPRAQRLAARGLAVPVDPAMSDADLARVVAALG